MCLTKEIFEKIKNQPGFDFIHGEGFILVDVGGLNSFEKLDLYIKIKSITKQVINADSNSTIYSDPESLKTFIIGEKLLYAVPINFDIYKRQKEEYIGFAPVITPSQINALYYFELNEISQGEFIREFKNLDNLINKKNE